MPFFFFFFPILAPKTKELLFKHTVYNQFSASLSYGRDMASQAKLAIYEKTSAMVLTVVLQ